MHRKANWKSQKLSPFKKKKKMVEKNTSASNPFEYLGPVCGFAVDLCEPVS